MIEIPQDVLFLMGAGILTILLCLVAATDQSEWMNDDE